MAIDTEAIAYHVKGILKALGEDPEREGLKETPERVARMYAEVFAGIAYSNHEIAEMFGKTFSKPETDAGQTVVTMKDISVFSYCEHHMALMYDMHVNVSYVPHGKVLGLSKVARICESGCNCRNGSDRILQKSSWKQQGHRMWALSLRVRIAA